MISQANNGSVVRAAYPTKVNAKETQGNVDLPKAEDTNKLQKLKELIDSGQYKVDIDALSKEIAKTLL